MQMLPVYVFLLCADPGQRWMGIPTVSKALNGTAEVISGMSKPEQQNKEDFFSVFASSKMPTQSLVTEYQTQSWKHVRWARVLGSAASIENDFVSCLKTRHLIIWSYIVLTPHAAGMMEHFSYLLRCSKAKTFEYYSKEEAAHIVPVLSIYLSHRKRLSTRQRKSVSFLMGKTQTYTTIAM